jgi:polyisoprenoid-binding protein YceI
MKLPRCCLQAVSAALTFATGMAVAQPVAYSLDPDHSWVHVEVLHFGTSTTRMRFGPVAGEVLLDRQASSGALTLRIATASVDTGLAFFNSRLRQGDLLASDEHPEAIYTATGFRFDGDRLAAVDGELTLRGVTRPLTLQALAFGCRDDAVRGTVCGGDFEGELYRTTYGMLFGWPFIANRVRLLVQVEALRRNQN